MGSTVRHWKLSQVEFWFLNLCLKQSQRLKTSTQTSLETNQNARTIQIIFYKIILSLNCTVKNY